MCVLLGCFQVVVGALVVIAKIPFFFGLTIVLFGKRGKRGAVEAGRERILDSDPFIEWYQPAGRQPQCSWALPDLWLWENTTARGSREAETALFVLKLAGKSCVVAVKMDIFLSMAQMGVTSAGPEHRSTRPFRRDRYPFVPQLFPAHVRVTLTLLHSTKWLMLPQTLDLEAGISMSE